MSNSHDFDHQNGRMQVIDHPIVAHSNSIRMFRASQFSDVHGIWVRGESVDVATILGTISDGKRLSSFAADRFHSILYKPIALQVRE